MQTATMATTKVMSSFDAPLIAMLVINLCNYFSFHPRAQKKAPEEKNDTTYKKRRREMEMFKLILRSTRSWHSAQESTAL